jgi:hypothetical protein
MTFIGEKCAELKETCLLTEKISFLFKLGTRKKKNPLMNRLSSCRQYQGNVVAYRTVWPPEPVWSWAWPGWWPRSCPQTQGPSGWCRARWRHAEPTVQQVTQYSSLSLHCSRPGAHLRDLITEVKAQCRLWKESSWRSSVSYKGISAKAFSLDLQVFLTFILN